MNLYELYGKNKAFRRYVDRYCQNYNEGRSISVAEALTHKIVRVYAEERSEKEDESITHIVQH